MTFMDIEEFSEEDIASFALYLADSSTEVACLTNSYVALVKAFEEYTSDKPFLDEWQLIDEIEEIDSSINKYSRSWKTGRMPKVDLAVMRLAVGEMKFSEDVPNAVAINEAIGNATSDANEQMGAITGGLNLPGMPSMF